MWIAKPVQRLSLAEREAWIRLQSGWLEKGFDVPLAQTLGWAAATETLGARAYLVCSPEEGAGGIAHTSLRPGCFECVNGPLIDWDEPGAAPRQLATFAMAVSKLTPEFETLTLRPRWDAERLEDRLRALPVTADTVDRAATIRVSARASREEQRALAAPRLQRSLERAERDGVRTEWRELRAAEDFGGGALAEFVGRLSRFGTERNFFVPELSWFTALATAGEDEGLSLHLAEAFAPEQARPCASLLIAMRPGTAFYLHGAEDPDARGALADGVSVSAPAHFRVLKECADLGVPYYDLGGWTEESEIDHPYGGVSRFKSQFGGEVRRYVCPELRIDAK